MSLIDMLYYCDEEISDVLTPQSSIPNISNMPNKPNEIIRAETDLNIINDDRVLANLLLIEDKYQSASSYFLFQDDIKPYMRKMVTNWMLEVCLEQARDDNVFLLAVSYLDRFLALVRINRTQLQLVATVCLFVASKVKESHPFNAQILAAYTDSSITVQQLLDWELQVLCILNWETCLVVSNDFFEHILHRLPIPKTYRTTILDHSKTFAALCATEHCFITYPPSVIAASCICASMSGFKSQTWIESNSIYDCLKSLTSIEADYIKACQKKIEDLHLSKVNENNNNTEAVNNNNNIVKSKKKKVPTATLR